MAPSNVGDEKKVPNHARVSSTGDARGETEMVSCACDEGRNDVELFGESSVADVDDRCFRGFTASSEDPGWLIRPGDDIVGVWAGAGGRLNGCGAGAGAGAGVGGRPEAGSAPTGSFGVWLRSGQRGSGCWRVFWGVTGVWPPWRPAPDACREPQR